MERLIGTKEIAEYLGLTRPYVTGVVVRQKGFPKPRVNTSAKTRKWSTQEVVAWAAGSQVQRPSGRAGERKTWND